MIHPIKCHRCHKDATVDDKDLTVVCEHCHLFKKLSSRAEMKRIILNRSRTK